MRGKKSCELNWFQYFHLPMPCPLGITVGCGPSFGCLEVGGKEAPYPPSLTILPLEENQAGVGQSHFTSVSVCLTIA